MIREHSVRLPFSYAAGEVGSAYLAALDDGVVLGTACEPCGRVLCPARSFCPLCGGSTGEPVPVGPGATVVAWTEVPGAGVFELVRYDGADGLVVRRRAEAP